MALTYDDYYNKQLKLITPQMNTAISESDSTFDKQKTAVRDNYNYQISEAEKSYEDSYRENAIQKLINERQVAESMANIGLTDSGLNRTQQTAVQLSYANNKSSIDRQKQAQVDALAQQLAATLSEIDINKSNAATNIKNTYYNQAAENATSLYNTDVQAETERYNQTTASRSQMSTIKQKALEIYNAGGDWKLAEYLDSLGLSDNERDDVLVYILGDGVTAGYGDRLEVFEVANKGFSTARKAASKVGSEAVSAANAISNKIYNSLSGFDKLKYRIRQAANKKISN